ncbi:MAG: bifunctional 2-C-methyl-D-erythritol 4-phosphate cytidylyltransferase/2-C-methyl-D-erythritol 2,4-cyclodiphosphate synthase [Alphaproteobacteria bacterium]|nr:bifunctional 2-C-methyl-D-erythritol 4-phosphate cytidylyltransferase/2-C-methyl-D-erythritol 2,4-cyclodiphosphate synthase [Alphaproteobacteria bacterium]
MLTSSKSFKTIALIMAAGRGQRVGGPIPKQYQSLHKQGPILAQTLSTFLRHPEVDAVRVIIREGDEKFYKECTHNFSSTKLLPPLTGGQERYDSVRLGLESLSSNTPRYVLIHDGARPFVTSGLITQVLRSLRDHKAVIPGVGVVDTLKRVTQNSVQNTVERKEIYCIQTPQGFDYETILNAYNSLKDFQNITDDASVLERLGMPVHMVQGEAANRKITIKEDMRGETMVVPNIRVGHGIDVHAIAPGEGVTILGIFIPCNFSLIGHSDADVGLHCITDALLGAIGDGDIGEHFNPNDERWKGADSTVFLKDALRRVRERGGKISHVDVTLLGEGPKVAPYRAQMKTKVAEILELDASQVSVKATTTERLGFIGREEGLAAFATATIIE